MTPLPADQALDHYFLEARSKLLDLAGILDRIGRGSRVSEVGRDPRLERIRSAIQTLLSNEPARAERIQRIFSLEYEPAWEKPRPK
jgi:hypothetical protein